MYKCKEIIKINKYKNMKYLKKMKLKRFYKASILKKQKTKKR